MQPIKGLHNDFREINQPDHTIRFALNAIADSSDGGLGSLMTEAGNSLCFTLESEIIGTISISDNEVAIFSVGDGYSEIGIAKKCVYTPYVKSTCLNFSKEYPIKGVARIKNCNRVIYWNDLLNNDRYFDFDNIELFKNGSDWDCSKFELIPAWIPFSVHVLNQKTFGSSLTKGTYAVAYAYEDSLGNRTDFFSFTDNLIIEKGERIVLQLVGIDLNYEFIRPALIKFSDEATNQVYFLDRIPISTNTFTHYINSLSSLIVSLPEINITSSRFLKSKVMEIVNKRLVRGNLEEEQIDWRQFQEKTNDVVVKWVAKLEEAYLNADQNVINQKSLRRDEVYDIGIVYVFDGFESPVFSIPGRTIITDSAFIALGNLNEDTRATVTGLNFDKSDVEVIAFNNTTIAADSIFDRDVEHLGLAVGDTIERWKVYNTAIRSETLNKTRGYWAFGGVCGYYEDEEQLYPASFGNLHNSPVRYHRMPTLTMCPVHKQYHEFFLPNEVQNKSFVHHLGIELENVTYPADYIDRIIGYRVVYSKLNDPTVIDTGLVERVTQLTNGTFNYITPSVPFQKSFNTDSDWTLDNAVTLVAVSNNVSFISPFAKFFNLNFGTYYSPQMYLRGTYQTTFDGSASAPDFGDKRYNAVLTGYHELTSPSYRKINDNKKIDINTVTFFNDFTIVNNGKQETDLLDTNHAPFFDTPGIMNYDAPDVTGEFGYILSTIKRNHKPLSNRYATTFISFNAELQNTTECTVFGGDTYLVDFAFRKTQRELVDEEMPDSVDKVVFENTTSILRFFTECSVNINQREEGFGFFTASDGTQQNADLFYPFSLLADTFLKREPEYRNYYSVPANINVVPFWKEYQVLSSTYELTQCSYPTLLAYSETSETTDNVDKFRIFRPNNLGLISQQRGEITNLFFYRQKLLVLTSSSLFQILPNPQEIQTNLSSIYIGTGSFLAIPEQELVESEWGFAGSSSRFAIKSTPEGLFYWDVEQGKVYRFYDSLEDISAKGMHNFFQSRRNYELVDQFYNDLGIEYPYEDNTLLSNGVGARLVYDPMYERVIFTKIDRKSRERLTDLYYCLDYEIDEQNTKFDGVKSNGLTITVPTSISQVYAPNTYTWRVSSVLDVTTDTTYAIRKPRLLFFLYVRDNLPSKVNWNATHLRIDSTTVLGTGQTFVFNGFEIGDVNNTNAIYQEVNTLYTDDGIFTVAPFIDTDLGIPMIFTPQLEYEECEMKLVLSSNLTVAPDDTIKMSIISPSVNEKVITDPFTNKVVEVRLDSLLDASFQPFYSLTTIFPKSVAQVIGVTVPETDTWELTLYASYQIGMITTPTVYIVKNNVLLETIVPSVSNNGFYNQLIISHNKIYSFDKNDKIELFVNRNNTIIENIDDAIGVMYPTSNATLELISTTNTERRKCDYFSIDKIIELDNLSGFSVEGYPLSYENANDKIPFLQKPLEWVPFYVFLDDLNLVIGDTSPISTYPLVEETGWYEIFTSEFFVTFESFFGAAQFTEMYVKYDGDIIGEFTYQTILSASASKDILKLDLTNSGQSLIYLEKGKQAPYIEITPQTDDFTGEPVNSNYNVYTRLSNATQTLSFDQCTGYAIKIYDSLTSIAEAALAITGADYIVSTSGTDERTLNFVEVEDSGLYDIVIQNTFRLEDGSYYLYINDVLQLPLFEQDFFGDSYQLVLKDVQLNKGDIIKSTVKDANYNTSVFTDEYLTMLVRKDYYCIENLPLSNQSFSISYDSKNGNWASFHSYLPKVMFNDSVTFYTTEDLKNVFKHEIDRNYLNFYNTNYPFIIEMIVTDYQATLLNSIHWIAETQIEQNGVWIPFNEKTFNKVWVRNDVQSTGILTLDKNQSTIFWDNVIKKVAYKNNEYRVGSIRDMADGFPLQTNEGTERSLDYLPDSIDVNKRLDKQAPLRGQYFKIRLILDDSNPQTRLILHLIKTLQQYSYG